MHLYSHHACYPPCTYDIVCALEEIRPKNYLTKPYFTCNMSSRQDIFHIKGGFIRPRSKLFQPENDFLSDLITNTCSRRQLQNFIWLNPTASSIPKLKEALRIHKLIMAISEYTESNNE